MEVLDALARADAGALKAALDDGGDPNTCDGDGVPALLHAAECGRSDLVAILLDAGADISSVDAIGWTALMAAVSAESDEVVQLLLERGAKVDHVGREDTPLSFAATDAPLPIVDLLLAHGADPNLRRPDGWTPLMLAAFAGDASLTQTLLDHGADPTLTMGPRLVDAATVAAAHRHTVVRDTLVTATREAAPDLESLWATVQKWYEEHAPHLTGLFESTLPGGELPESWQHLPADVENQLTNWSGVPFYDYSGLGLEEALAVWHGHNEAVETGAFVGRSPDHLGQDEPIVRVMWNEDWIPIAKDRDGNLLIVDMGPLESGIPGQLVSWSAELGPLSVLASSLTSYVAQLAGRARRGRLRLDSRSSGVLET